jgi:hypothetical protein
MIDIFQGKSANHHEPLDLARVQGDTADIPIVFKAQKGQSR